MQKLKIGITGAHGIGKTALAISLTSYLKELGFNAGYLKEFVRECPLPVGTKEKNSIDAQFWILCRQLTEELEGLNNFDIFVCDRTVIDNYAYFLWNLRNGEDGGNLQKIASEIFENWNSTYDLIVKLPVANMSLTTDGFRSTDIEWQKDIDKIVDEILAMNKIKHYLINSKDKVSEIVKLLNLESSDEVVHKKVGAELD